MEECYCLVLLKITLLYEYILRFCKLQRMVPNRAKRLKQFMLIHSRPISLYKYHSIDLLPKSIDWFLHDWIIGLK